MPSFLKLTECSMRGTLFFHVLSPENYVAATQAGRQLDENRNNFIQNKLRTVNKILKFPIETHKNPCYTIKHRINAAEGF